MLVCSEQLWLAGPPPPVLHASHHLPCEVSVSYEVFSLMLASYCVEIVLSPNEPLASIELSGYQSVSTLPVCQVPVSACEPVCQVPVSACEPVCQVPVSACKPVLSGACFCL